MDSISAAAAAAKSRRSKSLNKNLSLASTNECEAAAARSHFNTKSIKVTQKEKTNSTSHHVVESSFLAASAQSFLSLFKRSMRHKTAIQQQQQDERRHEADDANGLDTAPPSAYSSEACLFLLRRKSSSTSNLLNCKSMADSFGSSVQPHVSCSDDDSAICAQNTALSYELIIFPIRANRFQYNRI